MNQGAKRRGALVTVTALGLSVLVWAQLDGSEMGIKFLTQDTYAEAIACGRSGAECAVAPYQLCPADIQQYSAWIATPFSRVASSVFERLNRRQRPRAMERGPANDWGLGIYVSPKENSEKADSIQRVAVKRAGLTIEPTTTTLAPLSVGEGPTRQLSRGFFAFPMDTLSPGGGVTVVLSGASSEVTCSIDRDKLEGLR